ncbi:MAG: hypothetical protein CL571_00400 [Alphaproteobacteria bacterium]|nr:hypothetical protein [Alphaproteobacteria bacterium]|tara:strand:+ start:2095 stop:2781 length:687 start_codon:yes stop_codon:yes gene_type:complete
MNKQNIKISFIIPCFNEENNIQKTIKEIFNLSSKYTQKKIELIIVDDGSTDRTYEKIKVHKLVRKFQHKNNMGIGAAYKTGLKMAKGKYVIMIPGDNSHPTTSIEPIINNIEKSDIIIPFTTKKGKRSIIRFFLSKTFTFFLNYYFKLNIRYFNGTVLHKRSILNEIEINSDGFDYQAEILVKLILKGFSYKEVEVIINERREGESKAVSFTNGIKILRNLVKLKKSL